MIFIFTVEQSEKPTIKHLFIRSLFEKGLLLRHYTRNKGKLERFVGIVSEKLIALPDKGYYFYSCFINDLQT